MTGMKKGAVLVMPVKLAFSPTMRHDTAAYRPATTDV
jgi:hypothetical protein